LFVCVENANRSQMAQAFAAMHGGAQVAAYRAGSRPLGIVNAKAVAAMAELGYDLRQQVAERGARPAIRLRGGHGLRRRLPVRGRRHRLDWQIPDPKNLAPDEFRQDRDLVGRQVQALLAEAGVTT
ncbi:MAG TPA: hypothetical protein VF630_14135, partial [Hymenobacter sp.]